MTFNHERLSVYQRALAFNARVINLIVEWDSKHSIHDHLPRAAGSILENVAVGSAAYSGMKVKSLDYALGSTLECAALDIAGLKQLLDGSLVVSEKEGLSQLLKMLIGLRRSWSKEMVKEEGAEYGKKGNSEDSDNVHDKAVGVLFHLKALLSRVSAMTSAMIRRIQS